MGAAPTLEFSILGPLEARANGMPLALGGTKQRAVLAVLLLHANEVVSRDRLIDALWAERPPADAGHTLEVFVSRLRRALGKEAIETVRPGYRIAVSAEQLDVRRFQNLVEQAKESAPEPAAAQLREALSLFRGEPLSDFAYEPFAEEAIARLDDLRLATLEQRLEADLACGRHSEVVSELTELVAKHPLRERLRSQLMLALYRSGRQADALEAYQDARRALVDELGIEPGAELKELEAAILRQDASLVAPSDTALARRPTNLAVPPTRLIGRGHELADLRTLLARDDVRLVTLTGPGGSGKTRLALELRAELLDRFAAGVFLVPLPPVGDAALLLPTIAQALGLREAPGPTVADTLGVHLRDKELLLLVDNLEQLLPTAAAPLARLLAAAPRLKLLVTTRASLNVSGEYEYALSPLPPDDAYTLFTERARAAGADLDVSQNAEPVVREICARLDYLPLAIELGAARAKALAPGAILDRLEQRLALLTGGAHDLPERQRTLEATIAWSYDLLGPDERRLFARLSIFAGGWTLEAAEQICDADVDPLQSLIDQSLVRREDDRYRMLETLREFARDRLAKANDGDVTEARHAAYFVEFARQSGPELRRGIPAAIRRFEAELHNVRAALSWSLAHEPESATAIVASAWPFWCDQALLEECASLAARVLPHAHELPPLDRAELLHGAAQLVRSAGDLELAKRLTREELEIIETLGGHDARIGRGKADLAWIAVEERDYAAARTLADEALAARQRTDDVRGIGEAERTEIEAAILFFEGRVAEARTLFGEIALVQERLGMTGDAARTTMLMGECCRRLGELKEAAQHLGSALEFFAEVNAASAIPECLQEIAALALASGDASTAATLLGASERRRRELGTSLWDPPDWEATVAAVRERLGEAAYEEAWDRGAALDQSEAVELALAATAGR